MCVCVCFVCVSDECVRGYLCLRCVNMLCVWFVFVFVKEWCVCADFVWCECLYVCLVSVYLVYECVCCVCMCVCVERYLSKFMFVFVCKCVCRCVCGVWCKRMCAVLLLV